MVTLRNKRPEGDCIMAIEDGGGGAGGPRRCLTSVKLRLREERKRVIRKMDAKYRTIDNHEKSLRHFVLIRNNLRRLQREAREEKLARHRNNTEASSPFLTTPIRAYTPSPSPLIEDFPAPLTPMSSIDSNDSEDEPPVKRPRIFLDQDDDKENEHHGCGSTKMETISEDSDVDMKDDNSTTTNISQNSMDDAQEILRDIYYEICSPEALPQRNHSSLSSSCQDSSLSTSFSLSMAASCSTMASSTSCSMEADWSRQSQQHQYPCGHTSLLGNDLQSVVFHSLITSLES